MNEFAAKKLGEVLAFSRVGVETFERGKDAFDQVLENVDGCIASLKDHESKIVAAAESANVSDITLAKADSTGTKLRSMRDMYVGDQWDNPAELLEWSGFFEGAAVVHWALVEGAGKALALESLEDLADKSKDFHEDLLEDVTKSITKLGGEKATA